MKNIRWAWLAAAVLILATLACGGSDDTPTAAPPTDAPPPTMMPTNTPKSPVPTQAPAATEAPEGISIEITNESGQAIWYVYLSPSKAGNWGEDWLGDVIIGKGETHTIYGIQEGVYDIKATNEDGDEIEVFWSVNINENLTWSVSGLATLTVINDTDKTIDYLYIALSEGDSWGDDWLGEDVIPAGESYTVSGISHDVYDVKAKDPDDGFIEAIYSLTLDGTEDWRVIGKTFLPGNAVLRFEDEWEDNRNNWGSDTEGENVYYMRPADGEYCIRIKTANQAGVEWYEPFTTDEFVAEVGCRIDGADDAACALGFGPDVDNVYWLEVSPDEQGFALFLRENGSWQDSLIEWTVSKNIIPGGTNYLRLERVEGVVSVYVNAVLIGQADGTRFPTGRIGIGGSTYDTANVTACLDNLRVWRME